MVRFPCSFSLLTKHNLSLRPRRGPAEPISKGKWFLVVMVMALFAAALAGCPAGPQDDPPALTSAERDAQILAIADQFAASGDITAATDALSRLGVSDPAQTVLALAESYIAQNGEPQMTRNLAALAQALGPLSRMVGDYLAAVGRGVGQQAVAAAPTEPPTPTATPVPPTDTPTPVPPTDTPTTTPTTEPTATATPVPAPQVVAQGQGLNVRGGPGTVYPVIGEMRQGDTANVIGRNGDGSWWQISLDDGSEGWVVASLVATSGPVDAVEVAASIPAPPPTATPRPVAANPTNTPAPRPQPGVDFKIVKQRMLTIDENAGCLGNHNAFVKVVDLSGNPLNGVTVLAIWQTEVMRRDGKPDLVAVSGSKGSDFRGNPDGGWLQFDMYKTGEQVKVVRDVDGREVSSEVSRSLDVEDEKIGPELLMANGYCGSIEECQQKINENTLCRYHYSWEVVFQRQY